jgi:hypothetical protein
MHIGLWFTVEIDGSGGISANIHIQRAVMALGVCAIEHGSGLGKDRVQTFLKGKPAIDLYAKKLADLDSEIPAGFAIGSPNALRFDFASDQIGASGS